MIWYDTCTWNSSCQENRKFTIVTILYENMMKFMPRRSDAQWARLDNKCEMVHTVCGILYAVYTHEWRIWRFKPVQAMNRFDWNLFSICHQTSTARLRTVLRTARLRTAYGPLRPLSVFCIQFFKHYITAEWQVAYRFCEIYCTVIHCQWTYFKIRQSLTLSTGRPSDFKVIDLIYDLLITVKCV